MRNLVIVMALAAPFVRAQAPDQPRGTVNGKPVSQAQLEALINLIPEQQRPAISASPEELLRFYGFVEKMAEEANKEKLAEKSPYKEQLEVGRTHALAVAEMENYSRNISISTEEVDRYYQQHKDSFSTANITVAQVPIRNADQEAEAKATAEKLWKQVQSGADFAAMAEKYPVDGGFKAFKKSDPAIPAAVKDAVFALKPGAVSKPVVLPNGVFLIRLDSLEVKPLQEARGDIVKDMQNERFQKWMDGVRKSVVIGK